MNLKSAPNRTSQTEFPAQNVPSLLSGEELFEQLRKRILAGHYKNGKLPTIDSLESGEADGGTLKAKRHASRLAFKMLITEGLIETQGRGGTKVRAVRQKLATGPSRARVIAVISPGLMHSEFLDKMISGILTAINSYNEGKPDDERFRIIMSSADRDVAREGKLLRELSEEADGIMIYPVHSLLAGKESERDAEAYEIAAQRLPLIVMLRSVVKPLPGYLVSFPEEEVGMKIAGFVQAKMADIEVKRVLVVGEQKNSTLVQRADAIIETLQRLKVQVEIKRILDDQAIREEAGRRLAQDIIDKYPLREQRTIIICTSDLVAIGLLRKFREQNQDFCIGSQVMIIGVDGDSLGAYVQPTLTSLRLDPSALASQAVRKMIDMIEGVRPATNEFYATGSVGDFDLGETTGDGIRSLVFQAANDNSGVGIRTTSYE